MKINLARFLFAVVSILGLTASLGHAQIQQSNSAPQNKAAQQPGKVQEPSGNAQGDIKAVLIAQTAAWNRGDLEEFMKGYWNSPDLTFYSGGNIAQGWQAAMDRYKKNYQGTGKEMGKLEFQDLEVDVLSAAAAEVTGKWQLTKSDGTKPHGLFTLILKKFPGAGWRIVHDHTSAAE